MKSNASIVWFRSDLRIADNPAIAEALAHSETVVPVFIWNPNEELDLPPGAASRWWLHHSLASLNASLRAVGSRLIVRVADSAGELMDIALKTGADAVFWNRRYDPIGMSRDAAVQKYLEKRGVRVGTTNGSLLHEPAKVTSKAGRPCRVFTPFWNTVLSDLQVPAPLPSVTNLPFPNCDVASVELAALGLLPTIDWADGMRQVWTPGEHGAHERLEQFIEGPYATYATGRDRPDKDGVSKLSPHLHFGEISVRQIFCALNSIDTHTASERLSISQYIKELGWREFAHYVLFHFPTTVTRCMRPEFERLHSSIQTNETALAAWQKGLTGYPIVDAGMRQLWRTGWMHNRVRMIVGSFLTKDLFVDWRQGAAWFWDTLVDADLANNTLGWQWVAGCGADAAPYFRIFNPVLQGKTFDPYGDYVRQWVPELSLLSAEWIHEPWAAPPAVLEAAGVQLGVTYPVPIIDHSWARRRALDAFAAIKTQAPPADGSSSTSW